MERREMADWLVTGAAGMLGVDLVGGLRDRHKTVTACSHADLDVTDPLAVEAIVGMHDVVVNLAAWTAVDDAEEHEAAATLVNGSGPPYLAEAFSRTGARMIQ